MKTILLLGTVLGVAGYMAAQSRTDTPKPSFRTLSPQESSQLDRQRAVIANVARQRYGTASLTRSKADLPVLQRLLDDKVFNGSQTYELQCLGVAFGDVLASELPLRWMMMTDEYGTDPTLLHKGAELNVNALTIVSKRAERGEKVDLSSLLDFVRAQLATAVKKAKKL